MGKVIQLKTLLQIRKRAKRDGNIVVFTNGCFDLLHRGHVEYLNKAKTLGDLLIVGINSDLSVRKIKGRGRPIIREEDRSFLLGSLESVDYVVIFNEITPLKLIERVRPDVLVKGGDYRKREILGRETVQMSGGKVLTLPFVKGYSTRKLIKRIQRMRS